MRAIIYSLEISDGPMDFIHGFSYAIKELYVPELGICANLGGAQGQIFVFKDNGDRARQGRKAKDIDLPDSLVRHLSKYIKERELMEPELQKLLS